MKSGYIKLISLIGKRERNIEKRYYIDESYRKKVINDWMRDYLEHFARNYFCIQIVPDIKSLINSNYKQ